MAHDGSWRGCPPTGPSPSHLPAPPPADALMKAGAATPLRRDRRVCRAARVAVEPTGADDRGGSQGTTVGAATQSCRRCGSGEFSPTPTATSPSSPACAALSASTSSSRTASERCHDTRRGWPSGGLRAPTTGGCRTWSSDGAAWRHCRQGRAGHWRHLADERLGSVGKGRSYQWGRMGGRALLRRSATALSRPASPLPGASRMEDGR